MASRLSDEPFVGNELFCRNANEEALTLSQQVTQHCVVFIIMQLVFLDFLKISFKIFKILKKYFLCSSCK